MNGLGLLKCREMLFKLDSWGALKRYQMQMAANQQHPRYGHCQLLEVPGGTAMGEVES